MTPEEKNEKMEVKPSRDGKFVVSLFRHTKDSENDSDFVHDVNLVARDGKWDYQDYAGRCYVCFIHALAPT